MQMIFSFDIPHRWSSAIVKRTQNKHTYLETSVTQKYNSLYRDFHCSNSQFQPQG